MPTLDWNKWMSSWSAAFPKNQMWGKIRNGENDPETGEPLYAWNDKPSTQSMDPELADVLQEHRFVSPAVVDSADEEHCFCGWAGANWGDHYTEQVAAHAGDHNAPVENEDAEETGRGRRPGGSGAEKDDKAHKATRKPGGRAHNATKEASGDGADITPGPETVDGGDDKGNKFVKPGEVKDEPKLDRDK